MPEQFKAPPVPSQAPAATQRPRSTQQQSNPSQTSIHSTAPQQNVRMPVQNPHQQRPVTAQPSLSPQQRTSPQQRSGQQQQTRPLHQQSIQTAQRTVQTARPANPSQTRPQTGVYPQNPSNIQSNQTTTNEAVNLQRGKYDNNFAADFNLPPSVITSKSIGILLLIICIFGIIIGSVFFGGSSKPQVVGLQGVVPNQDITTRLPRCGRTDPGQACVLYIMNHTRYDKIAENFFDDAVRLTEVQKYSIAMVNPKYAKTRIPPGYFAEIKIPNVR